MGTCCSAYFRSRLLSWVIYQGCIFMTAVEGQVAGCCQVLFCFMVLHDDALLLVVLVLVFFLGSSIISLAGSRQYCCCQGGAIIGDKKTMKVNARSGNKSPSQMHLDIFTAIRDILPTLQHYRATIHPIMGIFTHQPNFLKPFSKNIDPIKGVPIKGVNFEF